VAEQHTAATRRQAEDAAAQHATAGSAHRQQCLLLEAKLLVRCVCQWSYPLQVVSSGGRVGGGARLEEEWSCQRVLTAGGLPP
jgi:hypothetical protein